MHFQLLPKLVAGREFNRGLICPYCHGSAPNIRETRLTPAANLFNHVSQCVLCHWFSSKISQIWCSADTLPFAPKGQLRYFKNLNCMHLIDACIFIQNITILKEHVFFTALLFGGKLYLYRTVSGDMLSFYYLNRRYFVVCIQGVFVSGFVLKSLCGHWVQTCSLPESPIPRLFPHYRGGQCGPRTPLARF